MALSRYSVIDVYTLEELRRQYRSSDVAGRIRFLAQFRKADDDPRGGTEVLPFDIVFMAAQDDSVEIRQWIARNGCFDSQNLSNRLDGVSDPIDTIVNHLKSDPDPFVRARLYENRVLFGLGNVDRAFADATHLERLALVRNPNFVIWATKLTCKILDQDDTELGINLEQRKELALAFISNPEAQTDSLRHTSRGYQKSGYRDWDVWESSAHWGAIWRLAGKWPLEQNSVALAVFENISVDEGVKAEVYQQLRDENLRYKILEFCDSTETQILALGIKDSDRFCRAAAYNKVPRWFYDAHASEFEALLNSDDKDALSGFVRNESLPVSVLEKVAARLEALGDDFGPIQAQETIRSITKKDSTVKEVPKPKATSRLPVLIVLVTGIFLALGGPLAMTLGVGLAGVAAALLYGRRHYP